MKFSDTQEAAQAGHAMLDAIEEQDMERLGKLFGSDGRVWRNFDPFPRSFAELRGGLSKMPSFLSSFKYEDRRVMEADGRSIVQTTLNATTKNGRAISMPMLLIVHSDENGIIYVEEYLDTAQMPPSDLTLTD